MHTGVYTSLPELRGVATCTKRQPSRLADTTRGTTWQSPPIHCFKRINQRSKTPHSAAHGASRFRDHSRPQEPPRIRNREGQKCEGMERKKETDRQQGSSCMW